MENNLDPAIPIDALIVDDEEGMRTVLHDLLKTFGYHALVARDAFEAIEILKNKSIPLVLCDISMPQMSGLELIRKLRERGTLSAVVMLTAHSDSTRMAEAIKLGAIDYLIKPISIETLGTKLPIWLEIGKRTEATKDEPSARMMELLRIKNSTYS